MEHRPNYRNFIISELERRQKKNPAYSLRAFARDLGIPCSRLSEIINRKMGLSQARAANLAEKLSLSPTEKEYFLDLALSEHARSPVVKEMATNRIKARESITTQMGEDEFSIVSDWYHLAIIEYFQLPSSVHTIEAVAKHFGLKTDEVEKAIERLEKVQMLLKKEDRWEIPSENRAATFRSDYKAVHNFYDQLASKGRNKVGAAGKHQWDLSASFIPIKKENSKKMLEKIRQFRRELLAEASSDADRDTIYCLTLQFFNLTELEANSLSELAENSLPQLEKNT
ncbi:TIGR02147 family protein [Bdellovibrio svalbardensis]|uniref:TIGR02147 family protein n=1 Tax=Bdellovibrio svalbardensis TaxID=2972972 RepID=A0ABT6DNF8_9BACT|nr:TIGR02147 family protein [Bdellovibrio svalbardensis]MDG0818042.1 TIGR02147 family protein [Bdellovibrio svalbardensis]